MIQGHFYRAIILFFICTLVVSCKSRFEEVVPDNDSFSSAGISKIKIENYVNRLFIDIIGRGPTDAEKAIEVDRMNEADLSEEVRLDLINRLMTDKTPSQNEGSYLEAYYNNLYLLAKIRCLDGVSDNEINEIKVNDLRIQLEQDSLSENWEGYNKTLNQLRRFEWMFESPKKLISGELKYHEMYAFIIDNDFYDELNMNSFNFINASYDELLFRFPLQEEYERAYEMVEFGMLNTIFGESGNSKGDYIRILINSNAMKEGMIRWAYQVYLQREGLAGEVATLLESYKVDEDINQVIAKILVTDEYANFY